MSSTSAEIDILIEKMRDTYESGKPVIAEIQERWSQHNDLLATLRFMYSFSEVDAALKKRLLGQLEELSKDMTAAFAVLNSYHGLTKVCVLLAEGEATQA
jgi:hypothetical protein